MHHHRAVHALAAAALYSVRHGPGAKLHLAVHLNIFFFIFPVIIIKSGNIVKEVTTPFTNHCRLFRQRWRQLSTSKFHRLCSKKLYTHKTHSEGAHVTHRIRKER